MAVPIGDVSTPDAHLWLWTTNPHLEIALQCVKHWGFDYISLVTWRKSKLGTGWWLRSRTEHVILAVKSKRLRANPGSFSTELVGKWRGHSVKPVEAYPMIERLSPGPRLELWARETEPRDGWVSLESHGKPVDAFGQEAKRKNLIPDVDDGVVRGVGGLEIRPNDSYTLLTKTIIPVPVVALEQKARRVRIQMEPAEKDGKPIRKWVSIDSLRPAEA